MTCSERVWFCTGLRQAQLQSAFGIDPSLDINTLDALAATLDAPSSPAAHVLKQAVKINNAVSVGANLLSNDSSTYASFAVTMNQAIAHQVPPCSTLNMSCKLRLLPLKQYPIHVLLLS